MITLPRGKLTVPTFLPTPPPGPQWITFLISISQKILLIIKDVQFDFRMCCASLLYTYLFPFLWIINLQFTNYAFLIFLFFKISKISLFWSKITIFIIEISLKHLHTKYGWNNPNSRRFGLKNKKNFFAISGSLKIHLTHKHSNTCHGLNFHLNFFLNARNNIFYQNQ